MYMENVNNFTVWHVKGFSHADQTKKKKHMEFRIYGDQNSAYEVTFLNFPALTDLWIDTFLKPDIQGPH